jgi:di/tricarboxylate transporter
MLIMSDLIQSRLTKIILATNLHSWGTPQYLGLLLHKMSVRRYRPLIGLIGQIYTDFFSFLLNDKRKSV